MLLALLGGLAGAIAGSFIAALTLRWPQGRSIVAGRSQCDECEHVLGPLELVPLLSFAMLRGRCRHCGAAIAPRHLWVEIAGAGIGAAALVQGLPGIGLVLFGWGLLALAILDVEHFWLPNLLALPLGLAGLACGLWLPPALLDRGIGAAVGFASLAGIAAGYKALTGRTGMGGGDPKLFAAIGAWVGWTVLPFVLLLAALLGLLLVASDRLQGRMVTGQTRIPLGALLAVAAFPAALLAPMLLP
ncbi:MAG: prepilin peptidase [Polymorphobacter sp.]